MCGFILATEMGVWVLHVPCWVPVDPALIEQAYNILYNWAAALQYLVLAGG